MNPRNIQPFPDIRDATTGEWLPTSFSQVQAHRRESEQVQKKQKVDSIFGNLLMSIFK